MEIEADIRFYQPVIIVTVQVSYIFAAALPALGRLHERPTDKSLVYLLGYGWSTRAKEPFLGTRGVEFDKSTFQFPRRECIQTLCPGGHFCVRGWNGFRAFGSYGALKRKKP